MPKRLAGAIRPRLISFDATPRSASNGRCRAPGGRAWSTVSLALRNHPSIPEATRARVRRAADQIGYLVEHVDLPPRSVPAPLVATTWSESAFRRWFTAENPEVILTGGDYATVLTWLKRAGVDVPGKVGVASLDLHVRDGSVAGIDQHSEELGAAVVDHLIARLHRNERGAPQRAVRMHVMGEWREGATIRPLPAPAR